MYQEAPPDPFQRDIGVALLHELQTDVRFAHCAAAWGVTHTNTASLHIRLFVKTNGRSHDSARLGHATVEIEDGYLAVRVFYYSGHPTLNTTIDLAEPSFLNQLCSVLSNPNES